LLRASVETVSAGLTSTFSVPFPYLAKAHVEVYVNGALRSPTTYTWTTDSSITLSDTPSSLSGSRIRRTRKTPSAQPLVDFVPGGIDPNDLDNVAKQMLYVVEEALDFVDSINFDSLSKNPGPDFDALNLLIRNLRSPEGRNDAATRGYVDDIAALIAAPGGAGTEALYVRRDGSSGPLITPAPTLDTHALPRAFADGRYFRSEVDQGFDTTTRLRMRNAIRAARALSPEVPISAGTTIPHAESGLSYLFAIGAGSQVLPLPAVANVFDGWSCVVRVTGSPSAFQAAQIQAEAGQTVTYRGFSARSFFLVGSGEMFRLTWLAGMGTWLAECLAQPTVLPSCSRGNTLAAWNSSPTAWTPLVAFMNSGSVPTHFNIGGNAFMVASIGIYQIVGIASFSAGAGGGVSGIGYLSAGTGSSSNAVLGYTYDTYDVSTGLGGGLSIQWSEALNAGNSRTPWFTASTAALYTFLANNQVAINMLER
jgi:hypothetical protein